MSRLNLKLKTSLKSAIQKEEATNNAPKNDPRWLPYYNLDAGQKITVLFLPCKTGEHLWATNNVHGPRFRDRDGKRVWGVPKLSCSRLAGDGECVVCNKMFDAYREGAKDDGNRLQVTTTHTMQVLVLESDIEIPVNEDGNAVKLFNVPSAVIEMVKQSILEEQLSEEDVLTTPYVIRMSKNGKNNSYDTSYFQRKTLSDEEYEEELSKFDVIEQYDLGSSELTYNSPNTAEQEKWLEDAMSKLDGGSDTNSRGGRESSSERNTGGSGRSSYTRREETPEYDEDVPHETHGSYDKEDDYDEPQQESEERSPRNRISDLRARLGKN